MADGSARMASRNNRAEAQNRRNGEQAGAPRELGTAAELLAGWGVGEAQIRRLIAG